MSEKNDNELLAEFARTESETAFALLVERYINLVYATALRCTNNSHHAEEISQAVFLILARKANSLGRDVVLSGWLYQTARLASANFLRSEMRRQQREHEAYMQSTLPESTDGSWEEIAPFLDEAMGKLNNSDRNAIVLRFFENKSTREVAAALQLNEPAAHKRVTRALEKLRRLFVRRGVTTGVAAIGSLICANSIHAAPVGLAKTIPAVAIGKGGAVTASTLILAKGTMKVMTWFKMKTAALVGAGVVIAAGTTAAVYDAIWADPHGQIQQFETAPEALVIRPSKFAKGVYPSGANLGTGNGKWIYTGATLVDLLTLAYHASPARTVLPPGLSQERYDLMLTLSTNQDTALQQKLKDDFGLTATREMREMDVLLLRLRDPKKLESHRFADLMTAVRHNGRGTLDARTFDLEQAVQRFLQKPVLDDTGSGNEDYFRYDYSFLTRKSASSEQRLADVQRNCLDEVGIELVPARKKIEVLVVSQKPNVESKRRP